MKKFSQLLIASLIVISTFVNCKKSSTEVTDPVGTAEVPAIYKKIYGALSVTSDGTYITIKTNGLPDHKSVYYPTSNAYMRALVEQPLAILLLIKTPTRLPHNR